MKSLPMGHNIKASFKKELHDLTVLLCCPFYTLVGLEAITSRIGGTNEDWVLANRLDTTTYFLSWDCIFCVDSDCKSLYCLGVIDLLMFSISKLGETSTKSILHEHPETKHLDHTVPSLKLYLLGIVYTHPEFESGMYWLKVCRKEI